MVEDLQSDWLSQKPQRLYQWSRVLLLGLLFGPFFGQVDVSRLAGNLAYGLAGSLFYGLIFGLDNKIQPAEVIIWSWKKAKDRLTFVLIVSLVVGLVGGLTAGVIVGQIAGLFYGLIVGPFFGLIVSLVYGLFISLIGGLSMKQLTERVYLSPNEGIWRSAKNGLRFILFFGLFFGLFIGLFDGLFDGLYYGLFAGLVAGLFYGLSAFILHFVIRIILWYTNCLPWNLILFLDEATDRLLLRKVGGSYIFVHRLLLEYFASLDESMSPESTSPESKL